VGEKEKEVARPPFYGALTSALLALTYIPEFSLWPPRLAGYLQ
jgi:hypothetical protein